MRGVFKYLQRFGSTCSIAIVLHTACSADRGPQPTTTGNKGSQTVPQGSPSQTPNAFPTGTVAPQVVINWNNPVGGNLPGMQAVNLTGIDVERDGRTLKLTELLNNEKKPKAVLQVIDILPGGALCGGCVAKANSIAGDVRGNALVAGSTTYVILLSGSGFTPSNESMAALKSNMTHDVILVKDINGRFASQFGSGFPPTAVLDFHQHGKVLNMHVGQPPEVATALMGLTD